MADEKKATAKKDGGAAEVKEKMDQELAQGFRGIEVDPTPNVNYSLKGVTTGLPTPETDDETKAKVDAFGKTLGKDPYQGK